MTGGLGIGLDGLWHGLLNPHGAYRLVLIEKGDGRTRAVRFANSIFELQEPSPVGWTRVAGFLGSELDAMRLLTAAARAAVA